MSRPKTERAVRPLAGPVAAAAFAALLAGCSDIYLDHRDTVGLSGGDAVAANEAMQTVDPWPPGSGNNNITFNGQRMQAAVERYRTNRVIPPSPPPPRGSRRRRPKPQRQRRVAACRTPRPARRRWLP